MRARNFLESLKYALAGVIYAVKTQRNLRFHLVAALLVFSLSFYLKLTNLELLFVVFATFLVIIAEMINTAVETVVDLASENYHPLARIAKDVAAGAVLLSSVNAVITAILIFGPKLMR